MWAGGPFTVGLPSSPSTRVTKAAAKEFFHQTNLVSDQPGVALITDPNLVNAWGITSSSTSPFWIADSGGNSGPARFIFATEDGTISGWNPAVDATHTIIAVDNSASGAIYEARQARALGMTDRDLQPARARDADLAAE